MLFDQALQAGKEPWEITAELGIDPERRLMKKYGLKCPIRKANPYRGMAKAMKTQMDYRIEKKNAFRIFGISAPLEADIEQNFETVPALWGKAAQDGTISRLCERMNGQPMGVLGVSACNEAAENWRYFIAVASTSEAEGFEKYTVPAFTWAIFPGEGTGISIQQLEQRIVAEWLPTSGYEYTNGPDVEVYLDPNPENTKYEVWIPVVKK